MFFGGIFAAPKRKRQETTNMELKQHILKKAFNLFMRYGIKSITMDDLSRDLGISKKTLYQYVENKADLIEQLFQQHIEEEKRIMAHIQRESVDAIDELLKIARYVMQKLHELSPTTVLDLQKYYPNTWREMEALHQRHVFAIIKQNMERGIREGVYRADMQLDIIAKLYVGKSMLVTDGSLFPASEYDISRLYREYINYHLHGIASPKGLQELGKYLAAEKQTG
jgi:AcrR family transcriptional regulator